MGEWVGGSVGEFGFGWVAGCVDGWVSLVLDGWGLEGSMGCMNEWMGGWIMDGWVDGLISS